MKKAVLLALALVSLGCATTYQPMKSTGGYREAKLSNDTYMVTFLANAYTAPDITSVFLLYRCAELTVQKGYDYFIPLNQVNQTQSGADPLGAALFGQTAALSKPGHSSTIKMFRGEKPSDNPNAFDARELMGNLKSEVFQHGSSSSLRESSETQAKRPQLVRGRAEAWKVIVTNTRQQLDVCRNIGKTSKAFDVARAGQMDAVREEAAVGGGNVVWMAGAGKAYVGDIFDCKVYGN